VCECLSCDTDRHMIFAEKYFLLSELPRSAESKKIPQIPLEKIYFLSIGDLKSLLKIKGLYPHLVP